MTKPVERSQKQRVFWLQQKQLWAVLILIIIGVLVESLGIQHAGKSMAAGGLLAYAAQSLFTLLAYRTTGVGKHKLIMLNMYLGLLVKWIVTIVGFALIFLFAKPIKPFAVLAGYIIMLIVHVMVSKKI